MKVLIGLLVALAIALAVAVWAGWLTAEYVRDQTFYMGQLIFGWGAWVCFIALIYAAIEDPRRIHGNNWFAVAGALLTGGAFLWWAYYYSKVPGTGGDVLPCLFVSPAIADWLAASWMHVVIPA